MKTMVKGKELKHDFKDCITPDGELCDLCKIIEKDICKCKTFYGMLNGKCTKCGGKFVNWYMLEEKLPKIKDTFLEEFREKIAELEHKQWQSWIKYIAEYFQTQTVNTFIATRSKNYLTDYKDLPEEEKDKDREWADKVIQILKDYEIYSF